MVRALVFTAAVLFIAGAASAQTASPPAAMGATSPLGTLGANAASGSAGIPLGATEIDPVGLSPLSSATCVGAIGSGAAFDGGGLPAGGLSPSTSSCSAASAIVGPDAATSILPGPGSNPSQTGVGLPLGATETTGAGLSPSIATPVQTTPLPGAGGTATSCGAPAGAVATNSC
jgi:hypothetical protein